MVELLSPVGDFECLKAAVQNGADAVYFGASLFSARAYATNFDNDNLERAINYAKLRGVKTHLTLNTLIKNDEFEDAINLAKKAYEYGIDAIIVQDLGLAKELIKSFPDLDIHASTQMTTTNLDGVKKLEELGFKRVVLARETSLSEIEHICKNSNIEIEVFMHGALCISYSGQCLFSSMVGGRSGNRGRCAQPCRLPYSLIDETNTVLDRGYLLSPRDLCTLDYLPDLIKAGVSSFKIEGRMKSPTYVATVTRIYRKYINLATKYLNNEIDKYIIDESDKNDLMQVFNRGGFSSGHILDEPNKKLIFKEKPNNMGIYLGKILKYNKNKGLVTVKLENKVSIGDGVSFENEDSKYTISELMDKNKNIKQGEKSQIVTFGRMKGNIKVSDKIYKLSSKDLSSIAFQSYNKEYKKVPIICDLSIHHNKKISVTVKSNNFNIQDSFDYEYIPDKAKNAPISKENILKQFNKTLNTCFEFSKINIDLDDNLFIPTSILNDIRRDGITRIENKIVENFKKQSSINCSMYKTCKNQVETLPNKQGTTCKKSLLLNILNKEYNYLKLKNVDKIFIPLKYFSDKSFEKSINDLSKRGNLYIYMPDIVKDKFVNSIKNVLNCAFSNYKICGIVVSNLSELSIIDKAYTSESIDLVANYTFNVFNDITKNKLLEIGFNTVTLSPEPDADSVNNVSENTELIVYGTIPLMHTGYCLLGKSNRCYKNCNMLCKSENRYYLKDRYDFKFRIIPDNLQTITAIYNSRKTKIDYSKLNISSVRFDFLDESIDEINSIL